MTEVGMPVAGVQCNSCFSDLYLTQIVCTQTRIQSHEELKEEEKKEDLLISNTFNNEADDQNYNKIAFRPGQMRERLASQEEYETLQVLRQRSNSLEQ